MLFSLGCTFNSYALIAVVQTQKSAQWLTSAFSLGTEMFLLLQAQARVQSKLNRILYTVRHFRYVVKSNTKIQVFLSQIRGMLVGS